MRLATLYGSQGQLIFLMGGDKGLADEVAPQLGVMGKAAHFLGDVGKGTEMKLVVNMVRHRFL